MQPSVYDDILPYILSVILRLAETIETLENLVLLAMENQPTERPGAERNPEEKEHGRNDLHGAGDDELQTARADRWYGLHG
jgi:hypothetical protein